MVAACSPSARGALPLLHPPTHPPPKKTPGLYCATQPALTGCTRIRISCWAGAYPGLTAHFAAASLDPISDTVTSYAPGPGGWFSSAAAGSHSVLLLLLLPPLLLPLLLLLLALAPAPGLTTSR